MIVIQLMILKVIGKDSVLRFRLVLVISLQRQCLKTGFHKTQPLQQEGAPYLAKLVYKLVYWWFWYTYHKWWYIEHYQTSEMVYNNPTNISLAQIPILSPFFPQWTPILPWWNHHIWWESPILCMEVPEIAVPRNHPISCCAFHFF